MRVNAFSCGIQLIETRGWCSMKTSIRPENATITIALTVSNVTRM